MKSTKKALLLSALSLLLCCSMLIGTTFAWFTDEVTSGTNKIYAGNLDVDVVDNAGNSIQDRDELFSGILWEPGVVAYENLTVKNLGTLALKYAMYINFENQNYVVDANGKLTPYGLASALKVAVVDGAITETDRDKLVASVNAADWTSLENLVETGALYPTNNMPTNVVDAASEKTYGIIIYWQPGENDNNWNVHNGKTTTDGEPLHIDLGIKLTATQHTHEEDSFDKYYDGLAFTPPANVITMGPKTVPVLNYGDLALDASFQFLPEESLEQAQASAQRYYHADFVVYADKTIKASDIMLAGYYKAWCDRPGIDSKWIGMSGSDTDVIEAGAEIRLVELLGATVNYEEICKYGNDGTGFMCGLADISGNNVLNGVTVTVELRVYETTGDPTTTTGSKNIETGRYAVAGTYTHTFTKSVSDSNELKAALDAGITDIQLGAGTYTFPASSLGADTTLYCDEGTVFEGKTSLNIKGATVVGATFTSEGNYLVKQQTINGTFKDCVFTNSDGLRSCIAGETVVFENCVFDTDFYGVHFDSGKNDVVFKNCTFSGFNTFGAALTKLTLENCTFKYNGKGGYNGINMWGNTELTNCTFVFDGSATEWIDLCGDNKTVTFTNCVVTDGTNETPIENVVGDYGTGNTIIFN